ncbi:signal peptidase I [Halorubellus sp. JP-L1]|uniref:signal peptidase I n=1 Tax=Halorubellus sp. JP-L1 TaxID=2715753 RepID=UPI00140CD6A0|nr:signal peptidase I [Halorubellus sp. JP-L1]NHN40580.1 signal peptidase I [Halorubellus sp. JP-L1]
MLRRVAERAAIALLSVVVISLVVGSMFGQPVLFSYVTSDSMAPTLDAGDGFVAVPVQLDDSIEAGDVVVFRAVETGGGGLTTHRIVGRTDEGFVTRGDGNAVTDQDAGEPPVKHEQVVATAWRVDGDVVVIPALGTVVEGTRSVLVQVQALVAGMLGVQGVQTPQFLSYAFFAVAFVWYVLGRAVGRHARERSRSIRRATGIDARLYVAGVVGLVVLAATATMLVPAGPTEYSIVSADYESERQTVVQRGGSVSVTHAIGNSGFLPVVSFLEPSGDGVDVEPRETAIPARGVVNASVTLHAPPETGYYRRYVTEHRYLAVLPQSTIRALYHVHPWVPIVVIDATIGVPFYLAGVRLVGRERLRRRARESPESVTARLRGYLTSLY